jgi:stage II sporulation protein D
VAKAEPAVLVRVLLGERSSLTLSFSGGHHGDLDGVPFATSLPLQWPLSARDGRLLVDGSEVGEALTLGTSEGASFDGVAYDGALRLVAQGDRLLVVNVLDLERYLRGVVPAEMQGSWPLEALKAQAVAARTYTLERLTPERPYDICATTDCQVYRGRALEHPAANEAIRATDGLVLTYGGVLARTYYHSDAGGHTASAFEVWGESLPYLPGVPDVPNSSPHGSWSARIDVGLASVLLERAGVGIGTLQRLVVLETSGSGRVVAAELIGSGGRVRLDGSRLRTQLRSWGLRSTRFSMTGDLSVRGQGWGHGVGMSQYGALAQAQAGRSFAEILDSYYPGTVMESFAEVRARQPELAGPAAAASVD